MSKSPHPKDEELCHELQVQVLALDLAQFEWAQEQEEEEHQQEQVMFSVVSMAVVAPHSAALPIQASRKLTWTPIIRGPVVNQPLEHIQVPFRASMITSPMTPRARRILATRPLEHIQVTLFGSV